MTQREEMLKRFDEKFGKAGPDKNCDSIGRIAGCDDCTANIELREEHKAFIQSEITLAVAEERKRIVEEVDEVIIKERETWTRESIGDKALQSLEMALKRQLTK